MFAPGARVVLGVLLAVAALLVAVDVGGLTSSDGGARYMAVFEVLFLLALVPALSVIWRRRTQPLTRPEEVVVAIGCAGLVATLVWAWLWFVPRLG